jgi:hypothetical protein
MRTVVVQYTPNGAYRNPLTGQINALLLSESLITRLARHLHRCEKTGKQIAKPLQLNSQRWYWLSLQEAK